MFSAANKNYYETARKNEEIFRNILEDLKNNKSKRPMGLYIPKNLEIDMPLEDIFKKYSEGNRHGQFTIGDFLISKDKSKASISFYDIACLSGGGAELEYIVAGNKVQYKGCLSTVMS
jgi:hypothetical protein